MLNYKLLRETTDLTDDIDHVLLQTPPDGLTPLPRGFISAAETADAAQIEFMVEWIDDTGDPVISSRGTFNATGVRRMGRAEPLGGVTFVDTVALVGVLAYRPFVIPDIVPGVDFTVLLSNMVAPGGATKARILYREFI